MSATTIPLPLPLAVVLCVVATAFGQSSFDTSPGGETGDKVLGSYFATDTDTVSMKNGNLHLTIPPLFSLSGREMPVGLWMDYNSKFFEPRRVPKAGGGTTTTWDFPYWRKDTGVGISDSRPGAAIDRPRLMAGLWMAAT